jgi:hypothetical protein
MLEIFNTLYEQLSSPEPLSVAIFMLGFYCLTTAVGITTGIKIGVRSLPSPSQRRGKFLLGALGVGLIAISVIYSLSLPVYAPSIREKLIYDGTDAKQIVADGDDVYLLKDNGNIYRISQDGLQLVDNGTGTKYISSAGGVLYILKNNGNIWAYQPVVGREPEKQNGFDKKDVGAGTKQIVSAGETLYILKDNGNIWKYFTHPTEGNVGIVIDEFVLIDDGTNTKQITSSGSVLYILKESGNIWQYVPTLSEPFQEIYKDGDAQSIKADGGALYFIKNDGSTWKYKGQFSVIEKDNAAKKVDALGGIVYILTNKEEIFRYISQDNDLTRYDKAGSNNRDIAAYGKDLFVIKDDYTVWRYNEFIFKR